MPTLEIPNDQVLDLIEQLPADAKRKALQRLFSDQTWDSLLSYGESKVDEQLRRRGPDRLQVADELLLVIHTGGN